MGVRAQGPPGTAALTGHLHTRGGCGAASGFGFPASPSVFVYLWMRHTGLARLCLRVHEFTAQNKQHPTQLCARCRHRRGSWAGNGSVYLHTPASCWGSEGGSHTALPCAHCDPQGMVSPCPGTPVQPPHSRVSHGLCAPGPCTDTPWVRPGLRPPVVTQWALWPQGLCRDWGGCTGEAVPELHWDHGGATLGLCTVCMAGLHQGWGGG